MHILYAEWCCQVLLVMKEVRTQYAGLMGFSLMIKTKQNTTKSTPRGKTSLDLTSWLEENIHKGIYDDDLAQDYKH